MTNNNLFVYSKQWVDILESRLMKQPIASLDAIVLGKFNGWGDSQTSSFFQGMQELSASVECVDFNAIKPQRIEAVAQVYNEPIVTALTTQPKLSQPYHPEIFDLKKQKQSPCTLKKTHNHLAPHTNSLYTHLDTIIDNPEFYQYETEKLDALLLVQAAVHAGKACRKRW
jgi:hypothetical protein